MEKEINYRYLRKIQQMEKNSPVLTELKPDFYDVLSKYLESLNNRLKNETSSQKQILLKEEITNIKKIALNIYEQREKKILLAVISKARGGNPDLKNMDIIEKNLFDPVLDLTLKSRNSIFKNENIKNQLTDIKKSESINKENTEKKQEISNPIVRVTKDIPEFIGTDEKRYNLRNNDIISLPEDMSEMLLKRGVVKKIR
jgi:DNA replication initiation complex subunit (GINS family)